VDPMNRAPVFRAGRLVLVAGLLSLVGFLLLALGLVVDPERTWLAYVMAYVFAFSIAVGGLIFLMSGYAASSRWMAVVRRVNEVVMLPMPALVVLFVPILFGLAIYPWHSPPADLGPAERAAIEHRAGFMNAEFFAIRGFIYLAIILFASWSLRAWSRRRDREIPPAFPLDDERVLGRERSFSSGMLVPVSLAFTFASIDWVMSLNPTWYSTIFPIYLFAGGFVTAIGLVTVLAARLWQAEAEREAAASPLTPNHFHALGRLLLAFVVFWAYAAFFQAMLIRIANKPDEVTFFRDRIEGVWAVLVVILIVGHFALPFFFLLPRRLKFRPRAMAAVGWWLLVMHLVDVEWMVIPAGSHGRISVHWLDLAALAAVGGAAVAVAAWRQNGVPLFAEGDPLLAAGAAYRSKL
jgi:hypothetical protein